LTIGSYYILTILIHPIHEQMLYLFRPYFHWFLSWVYCCLVLFSDTKKHRNWTYQGYTK
jgi:hypothetical protein